jgi:hypothetical protein
MTKIIAQTYTVNKERYERRPHDFAAKFWRLILAALVVVVAACLGWWCCMQSDAAEKRERRERAALVARADQQHAWILAGDDRGVYGDYRPLRGCVSASTPSSAVSGCNQSPDCSRRCHE